MFVVVDMRIELRMRVTSKFIPWAGSYEAPSYRLAMMAKRLHLRPVTFETTK